MITHKNKGNRMNIGIDIDDTINRLSDILPQYAIKYNEENKIDYEVAINRWGFEEAFGWDEDHIKKFLNQYIKRCYNEVGIKNEAQEYINKLKEDGNKIIIITARGSQHCGDIYNISKDWFIKQGINIDKLEVECPQKVEKCKENKIDIFIDDNVQNCKEVHEALNIPVLLFDSIYNQEDTTLKRVHSWKEAYEEIKKTINE